MNQSIVLGALITLFSALLWRKLDGIEKTNDKINDRLDRMAEQHHADMVTLQILVRNERK